MTQNLSQTAIPFQTWDLDLLVDYVLKFHHRNTRKYGEELLTRLNSLAATHPELDRVVDHFRNSIADLDLHCQKEENVLYPFILELYNASALGQQHASFHCGTIQYPINAMMADHSDEIERHLRIEELTNGYTAPEGAEAEYVKALSDLRQFRDYLLEHIYVENEVIFPRALKLE
ncbi:MAG: hemerythrin domain-containing protein [Prevotella sp.]|nr:hemerythrin domain-containing protein [Prevotella sp.]